MCRSHALQRDCKKLNPSKFDHWSVELSLSDRAELLRHLDKNNPPAGILDKEPDWKSWRNDSIPSTRIRAARL